VQAFGLLFGCHDLASIGADWAIVETHNLGRGVLITGTAPSQEAIELAKEKASQAYGVRSVTVRAEVEKTVLAAPVAAPAPAAPITTPIATPKPATLDTIISNGSVVLRGTLPDQASIDSILLKAGKAFGTDNISNQLSIGDNIEKLPDLGDLFFALSNKTTKLKPLRASVVSESLNLSGGIKSLELNESLNTQLNETLSLKIDNQLIVVAAPAEHKQCLDDVNQLLNNSRINFATGKAIIEKTSYDLLLSIKVTALKCPDASFEVSGHTDSTGKLSSNIDLSERRAQAVISHLESLGLSATRFTAIGYGPEQPIADNSTQEGRAMNRRIEFKLKN